MINQLKEALAWYDQGFMPVPLSPDHSKAPAVSRWKQWQHSRPPRSEVERLFRMIDHDGLGLITGEASGDLEMMELEGRALAEGLLNQLAAGLEAIGEKALWEKISKGYVELSPGGGLHYYFKIIEGKPLGNLKLARRPATAEELRLRPDDKIKVLIETRGQGGFTVIAPSGGRSHKTGLEWRVITGDPTTVPVITAAERDLIYMVARGLDQMPEPAPIGHQFQANGDHGDGLKPGDDFNEKANWADILQPHGWVVFRNVDDLMIYWQRPGKTHPGVSATTGLNDQDQLYVFSTATVFETERSYTKFGAYTLLNHGGDFKAAARDLRQKGYGSGEPGQLLPSLVINGASGQHRTDCDAGADDHADSQPLAPAIDEEAFWSSRPELTHIRHWAWAKGASAWTTLGCVLVNVLAAVPPTVTLPATIGGPVALNLNLAMVGESGQGKGLAPAAASQAVTINSPTTRKVLPPGSGEGMTRAFATYDRKSGWQRDTQSVIFDVDEVDTFTALASRQGSTIGAMIKTAFMGDRALEGPQPAEGCRWWHPPAFPVGQRHRQSGQEGGAASQSHHPGTG